VAVLLLLAYYYCP